MLPVVQRELLVSSRKWTPYVLRVLSALVALLALILMVREGVIWGIDSGQASFHLLTRITFWIVYFGGAVLTADSLAVERRDGTLGLLFLTDLKGYDVVLGKVAARFIAGLFSVLAVVPMLAITILMGGVSAGQFWRTVLVLVVALLFSASVGVVVSVLVRTRNGVMTTALLFLFLAGSLASILSFAFPASEFVWQAFWRFHPSAAFWASDDTVFKAEPERFVTPVGATVVITALLLTCACRRVSSSWQTRPPAGFWLRLQKLRTRVLHGSGVQRLELRRRLLDVHPLLWIHGRMRLMPRVLLLYLSVMSVLCATLLWTELFPWNDMGFAILPLLFVHVSLLAMVACEAANCFPRLTEEGAGELLLCTGLSDRALVEGHLLTLRRLFYGPSLIVLIYTAVWMTTALFRSLPELRILILVVAVCSAAMLLATSRAAALYSLYASLRPRLLRDVAGRSVLLVLGPPWLWYWIVLVVAPGIRTDASNAWVLFSVVTVANAAVVVWWSQRGLYRDLRRAIARDKA